MRHLLACAALTAASALWTPPAAAQIANLPAEVRAKIAEMGPVLTPRARPHDHGDVQAAGRG
jgi:hypothetical protein